LVSLNTGCVFPQGLNLTLVYRVGRQIFCSLLIGSNLALLYFFEKYPKFRAKMFRISKHFVPLRQCWTDAKFSGNQGRRNIARARGAVKSWGQRKLMKNQTKSLPIMPATVQQQCWPQN